MRVGAPVTYELVESDEDGALLRCPGCGKRIPAKDACDPHCVFAFDKWWHRPCHLKATPEYRLRDKLFRLQGDCWKEDPQTALSDLIGNLGHFATIQGIDFEEAIRRGVGYWQEETQ